EDGDWAAHAFAVSRDGTFEHGTSVLQLPVDPEDLERLSSVKERLLAARRQRPQPPRDDKVVAAWNGMAIAALTRYAHQRDAAWAEAAADRAARLLAEKHIVDGRLRRVSRDGVVGDAVGVLEDYGSVALAFVERYQAELGRPGAKRWLELAAQLVEVILEQFT